MAASAELASLGNGRGACRPDEQGRSRTCTLARYVHTHRDGVAGDVAALTLGEGVRKLLAVMRLSVCHHDHDLGGPLPGTSLRTEGLSARREKWKEQRGGEGGQASQRAPGIDRHPPSAPAWLLLLHLLLPPLLPKLPFSFIRCNTKQLVCHGDAHIYTLVHTLQMFWAGPGEHSSPTLSHLCCTNIWAQPAPVSFLPIPTKSLQLSILYIAGKGRSRLYVANKGGGALSFYHCGISSCRRVVTRHQTSASGHIAVHQNSACVQE